MMHRLIYFTWAGRAGAIRDALRIGEVPFEDVRLSYDEFINLRDQKKLPYDFLPTLELASGVMIGQSNTILRWAGHQARLCPADTEALLQMEAMLDVIEDYAVRLSVSIRETDLNVRQHLRRTLDTRWFPELYQLLTRHLSTGSAEWLVGDQFTVADLKAYHFVEKLTNGTLDNISSEALDHYPSLSVWFKRVATLRRAHHL